jgi:hypothetical protein
VTEIFHQEHAKGQAGARKQSVAFAAEIPCSAQSLACVGTEVREPRVQLSRALAVLDAVTLARFRSIP